MKNRNIISTLVLAAGIASLSASVWACTMQSFPTAVKSDFTVVVTNSGKPVVGLPIDIETVVPGDSEEKPGIVLSGVTSTRGTAAFLNVKTGDYSINVRQPALPYSVWIHIGKRAKEKPVGIIEIEWPGDALESRNVSGQLRVPQKTGSPILDLARPQFQFAAGATVTLADLISNRPIASTITDSEGKFTLPNPTPGLYVLHVERAADDSFIAVNADSPFRVAEDAKDLTADLYVRRICGGTYLTTNDPYGPVGH